MCPFYFREMSRYSHTYLKSMPERIVENDPSGCVEIGGVGGGGVPSSEVWPFE